MPGSERKPEVWTAADKPMLIIVIVDMRATVLSAGYRNRVLFVERVERWGPGIQATRENQCSAGKAEWA